MKDAQAFAATIRPPIVTRSLLVAVVVGTILNAINQGDAFWAGEPLEKTKLVLTYIVPFLVASFGSWSALRSIEQKRGR